MERLLRAVEKEMEHKRRRVGPWRDIQDAVERVLMETAVTRKQSGIFCTGTGATRQISARRAMAQAAGVPALDGVLAKIERISPARAYALTVLNTKFQSFVKPGMGADAALEALVKAAVELITSQEAPRWNSSRRARSMQRFRRSLEEQLRSKRHRRLVRQAAPPDLDEGLYGEYIPGALQPEEIEQAQNFLRPEQDELFTYPGWTCCPTICHPRLGPHAPLETPAGDVLGIALHLAMCEKRDPHGLGTEILRICQPDACDDGHAHAVQCAQAPSSALQLLH